ncbi:TPR repeat protein [Porphyrobacter sp. MBR-155]|jgi:TPR repeat protein|uniref:hypothetical protein n=1 Tax=Porphyrobacter sp. MBR-155 TaxID=3156464 RepID=UPI00339ACEE5
MPFLKMLAGLALLAAPVIASRQSPAVEAARAAAAQYDNEGARAIVTEACDAGDRAATDAQRTAAWEQARRAYRQGCDTGDRDSCVVLADMMIDGRGGDIDRAGAAALLEAECARDYYACETLLTALKP